MLKDEKDSQTFAIIGAAMEVHRQLGYGYLEAVYQEALAIEFLARKIPFEREAMLEINYKNQPLHTRYRADFTCYNEIILELKAQSAFANIDEAQLIHYLKATNFQRGLLINFGATSLQHRRLVFGYKTQQST